MKEKITKNQKILCVYTILALIFLFSLDTLMLNILPKSPNPNSTNRVLKRLTKEELQRKLEEKETFVLYYSKANNEEREKDFLILLEENSIFPLYEYKAYIKNEEILPVNLEEQPVLLKIINGDIIDLELVGEENVKNIEKFFVE